mgnify:CR=1 FL=1
MRRDEFLVLPWLPRVRKRDVLSAATTLRSVYPRLCPLVRRIHYRSQMRSVSKQPYQTELRHVSRLPQIAAAAAPVDTGVLKLLLYVHARIFVWVDELLSVRPVRRSRGTTGATPDDTRMRYVLPHI